MSRWGVLTLVLALIGACGGSGGSVGKPGAPKPPSVDDVCPAVARTFDAIEDASSRGCFRRAGEALVAMPPSPQRTLVAIELRQRAMSMLSVGEGAQWVHDDVSDPFLHLADGEDSIKAVLDATVHGELPRAVADDGRLLRIFVREVEPVPCSMSGPPDPDAVARFDHELTPVLTALKDVLFGPTTNPRMALSAATWLSWQCSTSDALNTREHAGAMLRDADAFDAALDADLSSVELAGFLAHAAELAELPDTDSDELVAYQIEVRATGGLRDISAGPILDKTLARNPKAAMTPAVRARIAFLRAAIAYAHDGDLTAARKQTADAIAQALAARRPDLADAARILGAVAAQLDGDTGEAARLFLDAFASAQARGAYGVVHELVVKVQKLVDVENVRGNDARAVALAEGLIPLVDTLPAFDLYFYAGPIAMALRDHGRLEEAASIVERALTRIASAPIAADKREFARGRFELLLHRIRQYLDPAAADADIPERLRTGATFHLSTAFTEGDERGIRAAFAEAGAPGDPLLPLLVTLLADASEHVCGMSGGHLATAARALLSAPGQKMIGDAIAGDAAEWNSGLGLGLELCGATLRRPDLVRLARSAYELADHGTVSPRDDASNRATALEAGGDFTGAAAAYLAIARPIANTDDSRSIIGATQRAQTWFDRAAIADLRAKHVDDAVAVLEESRGRAFRAVSSSGPPATADGRLGKLTKLESELAGLQHRARALTSIEARTGKDLSATTTQLATKISALEAARDAAARDLAGHQADAMRSGGFGDVPTVAELRSRLRADESLLYYVIQPDEAWAIVIGTSGATAVQLPATAADGMPELYLAINRARRSVGALLERGRGLARVSKATDASVPGSGADDLATLYRLLVAPVESAIPKGQRIIIAPDSVLVGLPFAAFGTAKHPWIERDPLRVVIGGFTLPPKPVPARTSGAIVVAGGASYEETGANAGRGLATGAAWSSLPGTEAEATQIAALYKTTPLLGRDLTEDSLRSRLAGARIIHLATHGFADLAQPAYSAIVLSVPEASSKDDGLLHAYEIERLVLDADAVVLSACETGRGAARGPEGALALDRAFLVAGARSVVSSLWVVPDTATAALMVELHHRLVDGAPIDVALAGAMNALRVDPRYADPQSWAAFRVIGAGLR